MNRSIYTNSQETHFPQNSLSQWYETNYQITSKLHNSSNYGECHWTDFSIVLTRGLWNYFPNELMSSEYAFEEESLKKLFILNPWWRSLNSNSFILNVPKIIQLTLEHMGLSSEGSFIYRFSFHEILLNVLSLPYDLLNILFSLA